MAFVCLPRLATRVRVPFSIRSSKFGRAIVAALVVVLCAFGFAGSAWAQQVPTSTYITITTTGGTPVSTVESGTVVVLTATVTQPSVEHPEVSPGIVNFCDGNAAHCQDIHLIASAQLTSNGIATYRFRPAPGVHKYYAAFVGTVNNDGPSSSPVETLTVTAGPYTTSSTIAKSGSAGNYTLTATVSSAGSGPVPPSGTVDFLDTNDSNYVLSAPTLTPGPTALSYAAVIASAGTSATQPMQAVMADFNQDGIPDIAVVTFNPTSGSGYPIDIYFGKGDGTFTKQSPIFTQGNAPIAIAAGDLNGDGYPDLVVSIAGALNVFINNGHGGFNAPTNYNLSFTDYTGTQAFQNPESLVLADVNGDGRLDVVFTFENGFDPLPPVLYGNPSLTGSFEGVIGVALGNGDGTLQWGSSPPFVSVYGVAGDNAQSLALADLSGSGKLDLITGDDRYICVQTGNGDGSFQNAVGNGLPGATCFINYPAGATSSIVVADFNGDGKPDLATSSGNSGFVSVLLGNGDRTFQAPEYGTGALIPTYVGGNQINSLVAADLNGDGKVDLATANFADNTVTVMLGNGDGTFLAPLLLFDGSESSQTALTAPAGNGPFTIMAGDLTGTGIPSLAVVDENSNTIGSLKASATTSSTATATGISPVGPSSGTHAVEASYAGDGFFSASVSATTSLTAQPVTTTLALQSNLSTVTVGAQVTLTASLSPGSAQGYSATGTVTFYDQGTSIGTASVSSGVATLQPHLNTVETASLTASYAGDSNFNSSSTTTPTSVTVQKATTSLSVEVCIPSVGPLLCGATVNTYGQLAVVQATLAPYNVTNGPTSDGETITFYNNGNMIGTATLTDGAASLTLDEPIVGSYSFSASYAGDATFVASNTTAPALFTVNKATSSLGLMTSPSPAPYGQQVTLTATFLPYEASSNTVNGETVTFYNNGVSVGSATLAGLTATLKLNNLAVGSYSFVAKYAGDQNFTSSNSSPASYAVQKLGTSLGVSASPSGSATYGEPITIQAFLSPSSVPGGNTTNGDLVTFLNNGNVIGTAALSNGSAMFTLNVPASGSNSFNATFGGDASFASSNGTPVFVTVLPEPTTLGISTSAINNTLATGQPLTLTATLLPYAQVGGASTDGDIITFNENGNVAGTGTLTNGVATLTLTGLASGSYFFSAQFPGDGNFQHSNTSVIASVRVIQGTTISMTTTPANFAALNQAVTLTATLSPFSFNGNSSDGELVTFYNGTEAIGGGTLSSGVATFNIPNGLPQATYSLTAVYTGDTFLAGSRSAAVPFSVATVENFVVNNSSDDVGSASNCTPQASTTSNATDSSCSLRDALLAAAAAPEGANITFDATVFGSAPTTINLVNGTLTVPSSTTITAPTLHSGETLQNLVTVSGGGAQLANTFTVFTVTGTGAVINNLIITGGYPVWNNGNPFPGGGIANSGSLALNYSTVTGNGAIANGGGIYNTGTLTIIGSTIDDNQAAYNAPGFGGGIDNEGTLTIINSTIANNTSSGNYGGGIYVGAGTVTMTNTTVSANHGWGGGIYNAGGTVTLANSIVSGNLRAFFSDIEGTYTDNGGNIIGYAGATQVMDPRNLGLGSLDNYGGPTRTMLPLPGGEAICTAKQANSPSFWNTNPINIDQRGYPNYNLSYGQIPAMQPTPSVCYDAGAVQSNYTAVQFGQSSYTGTPGGSVTPTVAVTVTENGQSRGAIPVTLNYSGPGFLDGGMATTIAGTGATFSSLSATNAGNGTLSTSFALAPYVGAPFPTPTTTLSASASLSVIGPVQISPTAQTFSTAVGLPFSENFTVSGGTGSYQLSSSGTLPTGLTLTPPGASSGSSWTLSGTPTQSGTFGLTLTATDANNSALVDTEIYSISVAPGSTTVLAASPVSPAGYGQTVTLTATVTPPTATGYVNFFDGSNVLGSSAVNFDGTNNTASLALNAGTLGSSLASGTHSFSAQYLGDSNNAASNSNSISYTVNSPNFVVNTTSDDNGAYTCTPLASTTSNTTDGNNGGNPGLCTLRDALNSANAIAVPASVYFDTGIFAASNLVGNPAANTIFPNIAGNGGLSIPANTTIQGLTSGSGASLTNLVTIDGGGSSVGSNATIFVTNGSGTTINNLNINNGFASNGGNGGAITNFGSITVTNSSFTGNQATAAGGGIFNVGGSVTVIGSTFANNSGTAGGAIDNSFLSGTCGSVTITNSTFFQNSATNFGAGLGGAIYNDFGGCTLTVTNSTIYGNSTDNSGNSGVGIYNNPISTVNLANSIVSGNLDGSASEDDLYNNSGTVNDQGGNVVGDGQSQIQIGPLAANGGPNQTMVPLVGSPAICSGSAANIPSGVTTDERGLPFNPSGTCPSGSVDSGAVQTNYALVFTQQPSSSGSTATVNAGTPVSATVFVTESGNPVTGATVNMSDSASTAVGATTSIAGTATVSLSFATAETGDTLIASLPLNPSLPLSLSTTSYPFNVAAFAPPVLTTPNPGSTLGGSSQMFTWTAGIGTPLYQLQVGTKAGAGDVFKSGFLHGTSVNVPSIPANGVALYVRLWYQVNGIWNPIDYTYIQSGSPTPPVLTTPSPGSTLGGTSQMFTWTAGAGSALYQLNIGTTGPGAGDVFKSGFVSGTSVNVPSIPAIGGTLFVRLWYQVNGVWNPIDYTYVESGSPTPPALTTPNPGSTLGGTSQQFTWTAGTGVTLYQLNVGTKAGAGDVFKSGFLHGTSVNVPSIPAAGETLYVRLWYQLNGVWNPLDYTYTQSGSPMPPVLTTPNPGSTLGGTSQQFTWTAGTGATLYQLNVGTKAGAGGVFKSGFVHGTSVNVPSLPANGATLYVRLWYQQNGVWIPIDYTYIQSGAPTPPALTTPAPSSTLGGTSQLFTWSPGAGPTLFQLQVGTTKPGSTDVFKSSFVSGTSVNVPSIPATGGTLYVRLWYQVNGVWNPIDYTYTESSTPTSSSIKARSESGP